MITPGFNLTASERILPSVSLIFTTAALDSRITVTRSLNTATRVNSSGYIETINADLPRFDFSPTNIGSCQGLLVEETRVNYCPWNVQFDRGEWNNASPNIPTVSANTLDTLSPDGTNNADKITASTGGTNSQLRQSISGSFSGVYTVSVFIKAGNSAQSRLRLFNNSFSTIANALINWSGTTLTSLTSVTGEASFTPWINGWYRVTITSTSTSSTAALLPTFYPDSSAGTGYVYLYGTQIEAGNFATSFILTTSTNVTRNADVVSMTGTNFSNWWVATNGGMIVQYTPSTVSGVRPIVQFDDNTADNIIALRGNTTNPELYIKATTDQAQIDAGTIAANTNYGLAGAWNTNDCAAAINGNAAVIDTSATIPTVTQARLGSDGTNYLNGWLQNIRYWPQRITNAETQAFSKL